MIIMISLLSGSTPLQLPVTCHACDTLLHLLRLSDDSDGLCGGGLTLWAWSDQATKHARKISVGYYQSHELSLAGRYYGVYHLYAFVENSTTDMDTIRKDRSMGSKEEVSRMVA